MYVYCLLLLFKMMHYRTSQLRCCAQNWEWWITFGAKKVFL